MSWVPELSDRRRRQILGVFLVALGALTAASLFTYRAPVEGARPWAEPNAAGPLGAWLAQGLVGFWGRVVAWGCDRDSGAGQCSVPAAARRGVRAIAAGTNHSLALKDGR